MAVKFSQFTVGATLSDVDYLVGYKSTSNVQIPVGLVSANTTYTVATAQSGLNETITLTGSDATSNVITLTAGANITLTDNGLGNGFTIAGPDSDTYDLNSSTSGSNVDLNLTSGSGTDNSLVTLVPAGRITITQVGNVITFDTSASGTVTSVNAGTGIAVDNSNPDAPIVSNTGVLSNIAGTGIAVSGATGDSTITNTAPDQIVAITGTGGATITGTYPNFNVNTTDGLGVETIVAGTAINVNSTDPANPIVTNTAPDQTVVITGSGDTTVTGTYPNFNVTSDSGVTQIVGGNDISITPVGGTGIVTINSTSQGGVTSLIAGSNITLNPSNGLGDVTVTSADTVYTSGADISITNKVITNTAPDQVVAITGSGEASISGTYPNFNVDVTAGTQGIISKDSFVGNGVQTNYQLSVTPTSATYTEVFISGVYQEASTYSLTTDTIILSTAPDSGDTLEVVTFDLGTAGGGGGSGAVDSIVAGTGISVSGPTGNVTVTNSQPDQTVVLSNGTGITTTGTYPNFTITNSQPDQTVSLTGSGAASITGTYPSFNVDATNTTYTAGTGLSLVGTEFSNTAPDQTVALTGTGSSTITGTYPNFNVDTPVIDTNDFITNANDVYPSVNKVTDIISLTQAEYNALTPDESALYVIIG